MYDRPLDPKKYGNDTEETNEYLKRLFSNVLSPEDFDLLIQRSKSKSNERNAPENSRVGDKEKPCDGNT
jgi:hypothetical protein